MLHSKLVPRFYRMKWERRGKKSGVKKRIDLNIPHIIVKMRNQGHVSCSGNIVVCVNFLYNHLMPPVFTVKANFLEYKCTILFFLLLSGDAKQCFIVE